MRQQINLYQDILINKPEPFQSRQVGIILVAIVICLALVGFYSYQQVNSLQTQADELRQQQQLARAQVVELEKQYPVRSPNILLQEKIKRLEQKLQGQRKALDYFTRQDRESNGTILASLEGLARHPLQGIWLRQISLLKRGQEVQLSGSALKPEDIPDYLQLLGEKNVFGGQVFARLKLNRLKERADQVDFKLDSAQEATR
ncbi:MAG: PilN domain-containing protein [Thermodesulfobacteriota bacterium]|nr:PilN domain-containing protein [Thermodesulfobacteriota bacterium]